MDVRGQVPRASYVYIEAEKRLQFVTTGDPACESGEDGGAGVPQTLTHRP